MIHQPLRRSILLVVLLGCLVLVHKCQAQNVLPQIAPPQIQIKLNQIIQRGAMPAQVGPGKPQEDEQKGNGDTKARDAVDARAPYDRRVAGLLDQAAKRAQNKDWNTAFDALRIALDRPPALVRDSSGEYRATSVVANQILGKMPEEALKLYELKYGIAARQLLEKAQTSGDPALLSHVATRYFHTEAGYRAADQLATYFLDRGDLVVAGHWFRSLQDVNADMTRLVSWQLKSALANRESVDSKRTAKVGGHQVNAQEWIDASLALGMGSTDPELLKDWPQMNGNAARRAVASGGDPLLLKRWNHPVTGSAVLLPDLKSLIQSIEDNKKVVIPSTMPIAVNGRLIYRSLRGISVVEADTGTRLWESSPGVSAEQIFLDRRGGRVGGLSSFRVTSRNGQQTSNYDLNEVSSVLFRDGVWGLVSSDSQRIFVLEDHPIAGTNRSAYSFSSRRPTDRYNRDWTSNRLTAYDVNLGRPAWQVGGSELGETFDLPLAGTSFLGVPLVDEDEALVIGEREAEVYLHALDATTGKPKWSALLGFAETPIDRDVVRRNWAAQVAIDGGVIICPTTLGWVIAIDRTSQSILWATRFSKVKPTPPQRTSRYTVANQLKSLNDRWGPSTPIIVNNRVLVTPPEEPVLCCLDLTNGEKLWQVDKGSHLYIAAVHNKTVVLVGKEAVTGLNLKDGKEVWSRKLDTPVVGIGVPVDDRYYLPMQDGHIASVSLDTGQILKRFRPDSDSTRLGNLLMYGGQVFSQSTLGMTAFEQREAFVKEVANRKKKTPEDAWTKLQSARIQLTEGEAGDAAQLLAEINPKSLRPNDRNELKAIRKQALMTIIRNDKDNATAAIEQLSALADSPAAELQVVRMKFENELKWGRRPAAIEHLFEMVDQDTDQFVELEHLPGTIRLSSWLSGQFSEMKQLISAPELQSMNSRIAELASAATDGSAQQQQRFLDIFGKHEVAIPVAEKLADHLIEDNRLAEAESILLRLAWHAGPTADSAHFKLATILESHKQTADATAIYERLSQSPAEALPSGSEDDRSVQDLASEAFQRLSEQPKPVVEPWGDEWQVNRMGSNYSSRFRSRDLDLLPGELEYFTNYRITHDQSSGRINFIKQNDDVEWSVPFHRYQSNQAVTARRVGHRLYVLHAEVLQCLSPIEKRVVWTRRFSDSIPSYPTTIYRSNQLGVNHNGAQMVGETRATRDSRSMLAIVNTDYLAIRGRTTIQILDAATGETRFELSRQSTATQVYGTRDAIVLKESESEAVILSSADGTRIDATFPKLSTPLIDQTETGLITLDARKVLFGLMSPTTVVKKIDPTRKEADQTVWETKVSGKNWYSQIDADTLAAVSSTGKLRLVDLNSGQLTELGSPVSKKTELQSAIVLADADRLYVLATTKSHYHSFGSNLPTAPVNGDLVAVSRTDGKVLWSTKADSGNLILDHLRQAPLLIVTSRKIVTANGRSRSVSSVMAIDKTTGNVAASTQGGTSDTYQSMRISREGRFMELRSYNHRLRVFAKAPPK